MLSERSIKVLKRDTKVIALVLFGRENICIDVLFIRRW